MIATILDTKTGLIKKVDGPRSFEWAEGNYSCDCNRNFFDIDTNKNSIFCDGSKRFIITKVEMNSPDDYEYTLLELNESYPIEILIEYGIY